MDAATRTPRDPRGVCVFVSRHRTNAASAAEPSRGFSRGPSRGFSRGPCSRKHDTHPGPVRHSPGPRSSLVPDAVDHHQNRLPRAWLAGLKGSTLSAAQRKHFSCGCPRGAGRFHRGDLHPNANRTRGLRVPNGSNADLGQQRACHDCACSTPASSTHVQILSLSVRPHYSKDREQRCNRQPEPQVPDITALVTITETTVGFS